jgi:hypothetical protein
MEIIKRGTLPADKKLEWTCKYCDSVMLARISEGEARYSRNETLVRFICPVCQKEGWGYP